MAIFFSLNFETPSQKNKFESIKKSTRINQFLLTLKLSDMRGIFSSALITLFIFIFNCFFHFHTWKKIASNKEAIAQSKSNNPKSNLPDLKDRTAEENKTSVTRLNKSQSMQLLCRH